MPTRRDHAFFTLVARFDRVSSIRLVARTSPTASALCSAADIAKKGFLTRNGIFAFLIENFDCLAIRAGGALVDLLGKPIAESSVLCIPTATYALPGGAAGAARAWQFISRQQPLCPMYELGWKSLGVLDLTALPSIGKELWVPMVQETDVPLVNGGAPCICATGCGSPGWQTSCRRCARSTWD